MIEGSRPSAAAEPSADGAITGRGAMTITDGALREGAEPSLAEAFTHEHDQIDAGIEEYLADPDPGGDPARRARPLLRAMEALRRHIYLEEEVVFPHLPPGPLMMPLMVMRREHGELWTRMDTLAARLGDVASPAPGLAEACTELLALLEEHNRKEEPIIYPHMDADLAEHEQVLIRELLEEGTLPEGWICQRCDEPPAAGPGSGGCEARREAAYPRRRDRSRAGRVLLSTISG